MRLIILNWLIFIIFISKCQQHFVKKENSQLDKNFKHKNTIDSIIPTLPNVTIPSILF